jgi:drug/metabolite transporter (DMT)-like permease
MTPPDDPAPRQPSAWSLVLAFLLVYFSWGTTFLATKIGVQVIPPALFGGVRVGLAGLVLLAYQVACRAPLRMSRRDTFWTALASVFMFLGGNLFMTVGQQTIDSSMAAVLVATTPLWMAILEALWPWGERLDPRGWLGLALGLAGVFLLLAPRLRQPLTLLQDSGPFLVIGSAFSWSLGSLVLRYRRPGGSNLLIASYQMILGGGGLTLVGLSLGEFARFAPGELTVRPLLAWLYLLVVGSLIGFVAYTWLLAHVPVSLAGTYAYVNPLVAILVGVLLGGEQVSSWTFGGMAVILGGVALVRSGRRPNRRSAARPPDRPGARRVRWGELRPAPVSERSVSTRACP